MECLVIPFTVIDQIFNPTYSIDNIDVYFVMQIVESCLNGVQVYPCGLPLAAMAASLPTLAMVETLSAQDRITHHLAELAKAVAEANPGMVVRPALDYVDLYGGGQAMTLTVSAYTDMPVRPGPHRLPRSAYGGPTLPNRGDA